MKKGLSLALSLILATSLLTACGGKPVQGDASNVESLDNNTSDVGDLSEYTPREDEYVIPENINWLTGEGDLADDVIGKKPVSFMINNAHQSWPQKGISEADVIYEMPVEGGYTRLLAVFSDYSKAEQFGSNRSVRHDFVEMATPLETIFFHWGGSTYGYDAIEAYDHGRVEGMIYGETYYYTDEELHKTRGLEHCRFIKAENVGRAIDELGIETELSEEAKTLLYNFNTDKDPVKYDEVANTVTVDFSTLITTVLEYDSSKETYTKKEYDEYTLDGNTGNPVEIDNFFVLYTDVSYMPNDINKEIALESGNGYYVTQGTYTKCSWEKGDCEDRLKVYDESGEELVVNTGNSWVLFAPHSVEEKTSFE